MLPKSQRLNLSESVNRSIFRHRAVETKYFVIYSRKSLDNLFKFGISISKKNVLKASNRNKLKRVIYSVLESHQLINKKIELLIVITKDFETIENNKQLIKEELVGVFDYLSKIDG